MSAYRQILAELSRPYCVEARWLVAALSQACDSLKAENAHRNAPLGSAASARRPAEPRRERPAVKRGIAVVPIHGALSRRPDLFGAELGSGSTSTDILSGQVRELATMPEVKCIVLDVDSPGGDLAGVTELADLIYSLRGAKRTIAVANSFAAGAAYWIASSCEELVIAPGALAGGLGVVQAHVDLSELYRKAGVKHSLVSAGKYKTEGNAFEPLGAPAGAHMQAQVDDYYDSLVRAVARNRGATQKAVREGFGEGRMLGPGARAVRAGLADRVASLNQVLLEQRFPGLGKAKARLSAALH